MVSFLKIYFMIGLITVFSVQMYAQGTVGSNEWMEGINPSVVEGQPILKFDKSELNVGKLSEDDAPVIYKFEFANVSNRKITINKIVTSCGCTVAKSDKKIVNPGDRGCILLTFNPFQKAGTLESHAFIYTNVSDKKPTAKITLLGEVTPTSDQWVGFPCAMGVLRLKRNTLLFNAVERTSGSVERMVCVNSGSKPLRLSALFIPDYAKFRTEPEVIPPGGQADIIISLDGRLIPDMVKEEFKFSITLGGIEVRPSDRTIRVKVTLASDKQIYK